MISILSATRMGGLVRLWTHGNVLGWLAPVLDFGSTKTYIILQMDIYAEYQLSESLGLGYTRT